MNKMSRREQTLLFFLGMVLVGVIFYIFIWTPSQLTKTVSLQTKDQLTAEKQKMDLTLPLFNKLESDLEVGLEEIDLELDKIQDNLNEAQFERWMFDLFRNRNVVVLSTNFSQAEVASPDPSFYVKNDPMYRIKSMILEINNINQRSNERPSTEAMLLKSTFEYSVKAKHGVFMDLLDDITLWNTTFFVNGVEYNFEDEVGTIVIDAYTIDKFEVEDNPRYDGQYSNSGLLGPYDLPQDLGTGSNPGTGSTPGTGTNTDTDTDIEDGIIIGNPPSTGQEKPGGK